MFDILSFISLAICLIGISSAYRGSLLFDFVTSMTIGTYAGVFIAVTWPQLYNTSILPLTQGNLLFIIPVILALLQFTTWFSRINWLARYPTSIMTGVGLGVALRALVGSQFLDQIAATILPITTSNPLTNFNNIYFIVTFCLSLYYFLFGYEMKGPWLTLNRISRIMILIAFGGQAGATFSDVGEKIMPYITIVRYLRNVIGSITG